MKYECWECGVPTDGTGLYVDVDGFGTMCESCMGLALARGAVTAEATALTDEDREREDRRVHKLIMEYADHSPARKRSNA